MNIKRRIIGGIRRMFNNNVFKVNVNTKKWFKHTVVRTVKTVAETALALIPAAVTITAVDWKTVFGTAALSGVICFLTCVAGIPEAGGTWNE